MLLTAIRSLARKALVLGAFGLAALGSANATIVVGVWDPAYDPVKFPDLGWRGKIVVDVPAACLAQGNGIYTTVSGPCDPSPVLELKVELYNLNDINETTLETLDFTAGFIYGVQDVGIDSPGVVLGFNSGLSGQIASTIPEAMINFEQAIFTIELKVNLLTGPEIALNWFTALGQGGTASDVNQIAPTFVFSVPEPAGLLLAGSGFLALAWARRRRAG